MSEILIIPDVHGRDFWKSYMRDFQTYSHIVCLGDYFDPYPSEGISQEDALENFRQLMAALKDVPTERKTLLTGNHDAHYVNDTFNELARGSRKSRAYEGRIRALLDAYIGTQIAWQCETGGKKFLFTHAGVGGKWYAKHRDLLPELDAGHLNQLATTDEGWKALSEVGNIRGGYEEEGGPLWCDVSELEWDEEEGCFEGWPYQIVGHSQQYDDPVIGHHFACIDTRRCFLLTEEGQLVPA